MKFHLNNKRVFLLFILPLVICASSLFAENSSQNTPTFEIIYFANLNGAIENCSCGDIPLGGLDRIFSVIKTYRAKNPDLIVIDGGGTFNPYPFKELNEAIVKSYQLIKPNIWLLSEQELSEGSDFLVKAAKRVNTGFIASNYSIKNIPTTNSKTFISKDSSKIKIFSFLQPGVVEGISEFENLQIQTEIEDFKNISSKDYNILVYHGEEEFLLKMNRAFSVFDLILTAHYQSSKMDTNSKPAIIGGGLDGESIAYIRLHKSKNTIKIKSERILMGPQVEADPGIGKIITTYKESLKQR